MENVLWRCKNLPSCPNLQNAVIMCGTNNIQHNSVEDIVDGIVEIALSLRRIYHPIAIFVCGILPRDSNWSINRVYIDEINNYLCCKSKLNGINFINHTDWTFQDGSLKPNLFYADKLHLIEEGNTKLHRYSTLSILMPVISMNLYQSLQRCLPVTQVSI